MKVTVRNCKDCARPMIGAKLQKRNQALRERYVPAGSHGMCSSCASTARRQGTLPNPAIRKVARMATNHCCDCGREMVGHYAAKQNPELREQYAVYSAHGMCNGCYRVAHRAGTLPNPAPRTSPGRRPLDDATLARLRSDVGICP